MSIHFFVEEVAFELDNASEYSHWLQLIILSHKRSLVNLNYIFCSDEYLLKMNQERLGHDYYTDIITFDNSESDQEIEGDIFISIERARENATANSATIDNEISRLLAHGLLHLLGQGDKTPEEKKVMREKEDACISLQKK